MKRIHAFEFNDQNWCPAYFRNQLTELLHFSAIKFQSYDLVIPLIEKVLSETNSNKVGDLCSGSSGPWSHLARQTTDVKITLTDKYPNAGVLENVSEQSGGKIDFATESVDATNVPEHLDGMRTIFTGFHHFRPDMAKSILQDAVEKKTAIGVFEFTERSVINFLFAPIIYPLISLLLTPFIKPFKWSRLFWTYIIPVGPLITLWDGIVSDLRTYSVSELEEIVGSIVSEGYRWEIGVEEAPSPGMKITYLIGYPESS